MVSKRLMELMSEAGYAAPELAGRAHKLAELIVKECIEVVTDTTNDSEWDGYNQATACAIEDHFGVKR